MVNMAKKAIESLYDCTCDVIEYQSYKKANKSTGKKMVTVLSDIPCRISFKTIPSSKEGTAALIGQSVKLFIATEHVIKAGSKIVVSDKHGRTNEYKNSGQPALYSNHQEIMLELFEGWA